MVKKRGGQVTFRLIDTKDGKKTFIPMGSKGLTEEEVTAIEEAFLKGELPDHDEEDDEMPLSKRRMLDMFTPEEAPKRIIMDPESDLFGFPDDGYDYTQHFADIGQGVYISSGDGVQTEDVEEGIDPELLEALEAAEDLPDEPLEGDVEEDRLEDNFIELANEGEALNVEAVREQSEQNALKKFTKNKKQEDIPDEEEWDEVEEYYEDDGEEYDEDEEWEDEDMEDEDYEDDHHEYRPSAATNETQQFIEDRFQEVLKMYDDDMIGELDEDDPEVKGSEDLSKYMNVFDDYLESVKVKPFHQEVAEAESGTIRKKRSTKQSQEEGISLREIANVIRENFLDREDETSSEEEVEEEQLYHDCESILSTYSTAYNHPTLLKDEPLRKKKIKLSSKTGIPVVEELDSADEEDTHVSVNLGQPRPKHETKEEKKLRKQEVKALRKEKRQLKKQLKEQFKKEEIKQAAVVAHQQKQKKTLTKF